MLWNKEINILTGRISAKKNSCFIAYTTAVVCNTTFDPDFAVQIAVQYVISERDVRTW